MRQLTEKDVYKLDNNSFNRLFAIGDIHGCLTELNIMLDYLEEAEGFDQTDQLIFTGDYVDRGEDSPGVINRLIQWKIKYPKTIFLRGNHEAMMLGYLQVYHGRSDLTGGLFGLDFLHNGGNITNKQYKKQFKDIPESHIEFIQNTKLVVETDDYYFVHAGFFPGVPIEEQGYEDILWIREAFLYTGFDFGKTIVHGHTVTKLLKLNLDSKSSINLDTGCVKKGCLTCFNCSSLEAYTVKHKSHKDKYVYCHSTDELLKGIDIEHGKK